MMGKTLLIGSLLLVLAAVRAPSVDAVEVTYGDWLPYTGLAGTPDDMVKVLEQGEQDIDNYHYSGGPQGEAGAETQVFQVTWSTPYLGVRDCDRRGVYEDGEFAEWEYRNYGLGYEWKCGSMANGTMTQGGSISTFTPSDTPKETVVVTATVKDVKWSSDPDYTGMDEDANTITYSQTLKTFRVKVRMNVGSDYSIYEDDTAAGKWLTAYEGSGLTQCVQTTVLQCVGVVSDEDTWSKTITWTPIAETSASEVTVTRRNITFRPKLDFSGELMYVYSNPASCLDVQSALGVVAAASANPYVKAVAAASPALAGMCSYCAGYIAGASTIENAQSATIHCEDSHSHSPQILVPNKNLSNLDIPGVDFSLEPGGGPIKGSFEITTGALAKDSTTLQ